MLELFLQLFVLTSLLRTTLAVSISFKNQSNIQMKQKMNCVFSR
jgi:hypothetical protein